MTSTQPGDDNVHSTTTMPDNKKPTLDESRKEDGDMADDNGDENSNAAHADPSGDLKKGQSSANVESGDTSSPPTPKSDQAKDFSVATPSSITSEKENEEDQTSDMAGSAPPLPAGPPPAAAEEDDGWDYHWDQVNQAYYFSNRFTGESTWENPRMNPTSAAPAAPGITASSIENTQLSTPPATAVPPLPERLPAGGYNPAIHGDYDPNAWYAQNDNAEAEAESSTTAAQIDPAAASAAIAYAATGSFNRFTGRWQADAAQNPDNHSDEAKSRRQMNSFFDVDAAANAHNGRSLKAERSGKKPSKAELKQFKQKRKEKKDQKRRAWLMD